MTTNQQPDVPADESNPAQAADGLSAAGNARRKFARAGLGASGVLMTLASTPGMAAVCTTPSGSLSSGMDSSPKTRKDVTCGGFSPGYYKKRSHWPRQLKNDENRIFGSIFPCNGTHQTLHNLKLMDVFSCDQTIDPHNTGSHMLAAYMNMLSRSATVLTETMLNNIWTEYQNTGGGKDGYYTPTVNVKWYGPDIVKYILTTFHQVPVTP